MTTGWNLAPLAFAAVAVADAASGPLAAIELPAKAKDFTRDNPPPPSPKCPDAIVWVNTKTCISPA
jgi:hypothetical protein